MSTGPALKSGYLVKCAKESARNWRKRFFVLNGNTLSYYIDHKSLASAKGDILLVSDSLVRNEQVEDFEFAFRICTPFESLLVAARTAEERESWKQMVSSAIAYSQCSLRGYMFKRTKGFMATSVRKFFVFHGGVLSYHQDHEHTATVQYSIKINHDVKLECNDGKLKLFLHENSKSNDPLIIQFEQKNDQDYYTWKDALVTHIQKFDESVKQSKQYNSEILKDAILAAPLAHRPVKGGDQWPLYNNALTSKEFLVLDKIGASTGGKGPVVTSRYAIHPDCSVRETKLKDFAFELVTTKKIIHVAASSKEEMDQWIRAIKDIIADSEVDRNDTLLRAAIDKIAHDLLYEVNIEEYRPLGINLDKSAEWAIVKKSIFSDTGVKVGSALYSINGDVVMFEKYDTVMKHLRGWVTGALLPPLSLGFRMAPEKEGYLMKKSTVANVPTWKARYCVLMEGRFTLKESEDENSKVKGEIPLTGASISLLSTQETGKYFCFRILVGIYELIMQAADLKDMIDWAGTIYHAIAVANGGGHIIHHELARLRAEQERLDALELQKVEDENMHVVQMINRSIESNDITALTAALELANQLGISGELIDYAREHLLKMLDEEDEVMAQNALYEAEMLQGEINYTESSFDDSTKLNGDDANDIDYDAAEDADDTSPHSATISHQQMRRLSYKQQNNTAQTLDAAGRSLLTNLSNVSGAVEELDDEVMLSLGDTTDYSNLYENMVESNTSTYSAFEPADDKDIRKLFKYFIRVDQHQINVMQFSSIYRLVSGEKGNLFKEMQAFKKFDVDNSAAINEDEFVAGWLKLVNEYQSDDILKRIKQLVSGEGMCL